MKRLNEMGIYLKFSEVVKMTNGEISSLLKGCDEKRINDSKAIWRKCKNLVKLVYYCAKSTN